MCKDIIFNKHVVRLCTSAGCCSAMNETKKNEKFQNSLARRLGFRRSYQFLMFSKWSLDFRVESRSFVFKISPQFVRHRFNSNTRHRSRSHLVLITRYGNPFHSKWFFVCQSIRVDRAPYSKCKLFEDIPYCSSISLSIAFRITDDCRRLHESLTSHISSWKLLGRMQRKETKRRRRKTKTKKECKYWVSESHLQPAIKNYRLVKTCNFLFR